METAGVIGILRQSAAERALVREHRLSLLHVGYWVWGLRFRGLPKPAQTNWGVGG